MGFSKYTDNYWDSILSCQLFIDIPAELIDEMIESLDGHIKIYKKNEIVLNISDEFRYCGIVLNGSLEVSYNTNRFEKLNVNHFNAGQIFGEALALKGSTYSPVQITSLSDSAILFLNLKKLLLTPNICSKSCQYNHQLLLNLMRRMADQNVFSNLKLRILSQKSLRDRVVIYLTHMHADAPNGAEIPFSQTALAEFLGVNRSALARELGRMQNEEILTIDNRRYYLRIF